MKWIATGCLVLVFLYGIQAQKERGQRIIAEKRSAKILRELITQTTQDLYSASRTSQITHRNRDIAIFAAPPAVGPWNTTDDPNFTTKTERLHMPREDK